MPAGDKTLDEQFLPPGTHQPYEAAASRLLALQEILRARTYEEVFNYCKQQGPADTSALLARAERLFPPDKPPHAQAAQNAKYTYIWNELIALGARLMLAEEQAAANGELKAELSAMYEPDEEQAAPFDPTAHNALGLFIDEEPPTVG